ncbi:MAG: LLM class F420-dependent oxidoreductase [Gammaproteobacteria bacterium]|nr:LLM class F420-dependent oxidoreductase [Gammaproteobacteria bacterium]MYD81421.1 LLM class F420-dependent oxidoreductase [Gammaproteobacteria bacterium]
MKFGIVFPQTEIGADPDDIARFAHAVEEAGFDHLLAYEHVLGANTASRPNWSGPYTSESMFHEPFVLFGFLSAIVSHLEFVTGIVILPQRQTALVAKQSACLDVISRGRFRLGIGTGWNDVEYEALGENFHNRGKRSEEQIDLMRKLWSEDSITYQGKWHKVTDAGLNPLPINKSIPLWLGGTAPQVIDRVARMGDGWFPFFNPNLQSQIELVRERAAEVGRNPDEIGIECILPVGEMGSNERDRIKLCSDIGVTHVSAVTMGHGFKSVGEQVNAVKRYGDDVVSGLS